MHVGLAGWLDVCGVVVCQYAFSPRWMCVCVVVLVVVVVVVCVCVGGGGG